MDKLTKTPKKIELLIPAGNQKNLVAAVKNGADAVYFGVDKFNARRRADNFKLETIKETIKYCHENGVRCYCTLNILIKNNEITEFFDTIKQLYLANVDAVIIQHLSFLPIIKKNFPGLEVHISTQAAVSNSHFYELIKEADKIVLPREASKEEISDFIKKTKLPTEIFVQGAMCFSYSGKCLFSSFLGGRSGNRGLCAQPCRKRYNNKYLLSMKDLSLIKVIPELIEMGVASLKVEGRLRSTKYVAATTKLYRKAIDDYYASKFSVDTDLFKEMKLAFNREFTWGHYAQHKDLISPERPMGRGLYLGTIEKNNLIKLEEEVQIGDGVGIWLPKKVDGAIIRKISLDGQEVKQAQKGDMVKLFIHAKTGTKIYKTSSVKKSKEINFNKNEPIKIKKREMKKEMKKGQLKENTIEQEMTLPNTPVKTASDELLIKVYSLKDAKIARKYTTNNDKIFYNIFAEDFSKKFDAYVPRILNDTDVERAMELIKKNKCKNVLVGDLGIYSLLKDISINLYLDYSCNVFNELDMEYFSNTKTNNTETNNTKHQTTPIISPELCFSELKQFKNKNFAVLVHGKVVLMNTKYTLLPPKLKDAKLYTFPVRQEHNYYQILNSIELGLFDLIHEFKKEGINKFFLDLDSNVEKTLNIYQAILKGKTKKVTIHKFNFTKGHFDKGVE